MASEIGTCMTALSQLHTTRYEPNFLGLIFQLIVEVVGQAEHYQTIPKRLYTK